MGSAWADVAMVVWAILVIALVGVLAVEATSATRGLLRARAWRRTFDKVRGHRG